jgi:hypothetical protein
MNEVKNFMFMFGISKKMMAQMMSVTPNAVGNWLNGLPVPKYVLRNIEVWTANPKIMEYWK